MFSIGYHGRPVEALLECIYDQGARRNMVTADPSVDIAQQSLPLFYGDTTLQDPGVASPVELALNKDKGLGATREPLSLHFVRRQRLMEEVVKVRHPSVAQRVGLYHWILIKLHDFRVRWSRWLVSPRTQDRWPITGLFRLLTADQGFVLIASEDAY